MFHIQDKPNADLINQAYMLLFERSVPVSPSSPIITPPSQKISQDNLEEITLSQPASCNLQSPKDTVLTQSQLQSPTERVLTQSQLQSPTDRVLTRRQLQLQLGNFKL